MTEPIVIKHAATPKPGWPCPQCHGLGHACDGGISITQTETKIWPATPCYLCKGKGRVRVLPLEDDE